MCHLTNQERSVNFKISLLFPLRSAWTYILQHFDVVDVVWESQCHSRQESIISSVQEEGFQQDLSGAQSEERLLTEDKQWSFSHKKHAVINMCENTFQTTYRLCHGHVWFHSAASLVSFSQIDSTIYLFFAEKIKGSHCCSECERSSALLLGEHRLLVYFIPLCLFLYSLNSDFICVFLTVAAPVDPTAACRWNSSAESRNEQTGSVGKIKSRWFMAPRTRVERS